MTKGQHLISRPLLKDEGLKTELSLPPSGQTKELHVVKGSTVRVGWTLTLPPSPCQQLIMQRKCFHCRFLSAPNRDQRDGVHLRRDGGRPGSLHHPLMQSGQHDGVRL